jgi:hypothetical protein
MIRVFLAGEGPNDIGDWARHRSYRDDSPSPGVPEAILRKVRGDGWRVCGAVLWKKIHKLQVRPPAGAETKNVLGAALAARDAGCDVLVFVRDRDDSNANPRKERERDIEQGIARVPQDVSDQLRIVGGVAIRRLESWIVALSGKNGSEEMRRPEDALRELGIGDKSTGDMVEFVQDKVDLANVPSDARSLRRWLERGRDALCRSR